MPLANEQILSIILQFEGGFVNNVADHGGPTNFGITAATLGRFNGSSQPASTDDVRALTRAKAIEIYTKNYLTDPGFDQITNDGLRLVMMDSGVMHGPSRAIAWLRQCLKLSSTPKPVTKLDTALVQQVNALPNTGHLPIVFLRFRLKALAGIVANDRSQSIFLVGWINRVTSLLDEVV